MLRYKLLFTGVFIGLGGCSFLSPAPTHAPATVTARTPAPAPATASRAARPAPALPQRSPELLLQALAMSGFDYQRGGKSAVSGFDCSGLVAHVFKEAYGMSLPHNARAQSQHGKVIATSELEAGDLVFFNTDNTPYSHVGIYLGDDRFIHAPKPGAVVRTENMKLAYWRTRFDGARRLLD